MASPSSAAEPHEYEEVPEEVVETSFMCGECFLLFPTTEDFNAHHCQVAEVDKVEDVATEAVGDSEPSTSVLDVPQSTECVHIGVWEAGESEAAMEEAVASILGERMKRTITPQVNPVPEAQLEAVSEGVEDPQVNPILDHTVEECEQLEENVALEAVEIPTTNLYMYDNPVYLNRLMKDNTFGRRVRHDAPYSHRLGPWDNKSSRLLIQLLGEYPKAYFILDKECKRTEAWEMIRYKLAEAGHQFTVLQIRMRWRELCKKYRNTVNHNDMHNTRKTCQFFDELNVLFGVWDRPATLLLIRQLEANGGKPLGQNGGTRMRIKVWEHIRQVLASHGYKYTPDQVQGRWSNLVTLYQRMVEHNARPHNEPITIAFKDHIERIFNYVPERNSKWLKIMEKRGKTPKTMTKKWTVAMERNLLTYYHERVYRFNNDHVDNSILWKEIVQKLEEDGHSSTPEKVRVRFYELTKQFSLSEQHNSQPGTIRRECKHHEMLSEIYNIYNFWPHDRSSIKMEKTNTIRMRQVNAQLMWSEDQSRTLLQLYPQILVSHISNGEHQPMEELWLQLAKAYMNATNDRKQCYEIEEHFAVLRRGYRSQNPFPFVAEMQLLEETESTLGFTQEASPTTNDQLVSYWSHRAAHLLLDFVIHHRQEGVKNSGLFEVISKDLADYGYRYTGEECRLYYSLLRQLYTNRLRTIRRNKEMIKPFPYMDKMAEVDAVVSQPKFIETPESRLAVLSAAISKLKELKEEDGKIQREHIPAWLVDLKMFLKRNEIIHPTPSVKCLARILSEAVEDSSLDAKFVECHTILGCHLNFLKLISGKGISNVESSPTIKSKGRNTNPKSNPQPKYGTVQWTEKNLLTMLRVIKEWKLLCHDDAEVEAILGIGHPLWREVASRLSDHYKVDPNKCFERFIQLWREYRSVMTFNARLGTAEGAKSVMCQDMLGSILSLHVFHDAQLDPRDRWWASVEGKGWSQEETMELIFTVREVWSSLPEVNWDVVCQLLASSGYNHCSESSQENFHHLYETYQAAHEHNKTCSMRTRRRPPFYYKLRDLFGSDNVNFAVVKESADEQDISMDKTQVLPVLVSKLKSIKGHHCHGVPRRPLLLLLAQELNEYFQCMPPVFKSFNVWELLIHLHEVHYEAAERNTEVQNEVHLGDLWQKNPKALVAYGLLAVPISGWEKVSTWSFEEVCILVEAVINWELQQISLDKKDKAIAMAASELLKAHGYEKSTKQCEEQWKYVVSSFRRGGYRQFTNQINLIHLLSPCLLMQPNAQHLNKSNIRSEQQQIFSENQMAKVPSLPETDSIAMTQSSKKKKIENQEGITKTSNDEIGKDCKNNASENVTSYVQINVSKSNSKAKHLAQNSTDEPEDNEELAAPSLKESSEVPEIMKQKSVFLKNTENKRPKQTRGRGKVKRSSSPDANTELTGERVKRKRESSPVSVKSTKAEPPVQKSDDHLSASKSPRNKVQVEVLNITENGNAKSIECQTVPGITPTRTFKLHYPADHPLPPGLKHLYIPLDMIHPGSSPENVPASESSVTDVQSHLHSTPSSSEVLSVSNVKHELSGKVSEQSKDSDMCSALATDAHADSERKAIMKLLHQYSQECQQGKLRLFNVIQESNQQHISALKRILSVFRELQKSV